MPINHQEDKTLAIINKVYYTYIKEYILRSKYANNTVI